MGFAGVIWFGNILIGGISSILMHRVIIQAQPLCLLGYGYMRLIYCRSFCGCTFSSFFFRHYSNHIYLHFWLCRLVFCAKLLFWLWLVHLIYSNRAPFLFAFQCSVISLDQVFINSGIRVVFLSLIIHSYMIFTKQVTMTDTFTDNFFS